MSEQHTSIANNDEQQQQKEKAIREQQEVSSGLVKEQMAVQDELSKKVQQEHLESYQAWLKEENSREQSNQIAPARDSGLPAAPREPLPVQGTTQEKEHGQKALSAYKESGFLSTGQGMASVGGPQATAGDQALAEEKSFRERQQQLADKITDSNTPHEQRERLELVKAAEFHDHKAAQWENVGQLQQQLGYPDKSVQEAGNSRDHHKEQAGLIANHLHQYDQKMGTEPKQVQARMGHAAQPAHQHNEQSQISASRDQHLEVRASVQAKESKQDEQQTKPVNSAQQRLEQRREEAKRSFSGEKPNSYVQAQLAEAKGREQQIDASKSEQYSESQKRKETEFQHG